jgi:O-antigen/teichoic acid export membrane protein
VPQNEHQVEMSTEKQAGNRLLERKVLSNIAWLLWDKFLRIALGLFILGWLGRQLGPADFGLLNLAVALVGLGVAAAAIGLNAVVVQDILRRPDRATVTLGTAFALKAIVGIFIYFCLVVVAKVGWPQDKQLQVLVSILALGLIFKSTDVVLYWFEAKVRSKYVVWVQNVSFLIISAINICLLMWEASVVTFAWAMLLEAGFISFGLLHVLRRTGGDVKNWTVSIKRGCELVTESWPLLISTLTWVVYTRVDQLMVAHMLGNEAVGYYSAAVRISDLVVVLPAIIITSLVPAALDSSKITKTEYRRRFQQIYDLGIGVAVVAAMFVSFSAEFLVILLFGGSYQPAVLVLKLHVWCAVFVAMAVVSGRYLLNEGLQKFTMKRHLIGMVANVILNYFMIPIYGLPGAAVASVVSLVVANYVLDLAHPLTKVCFRQKTKAISFLSISRSLIRGIKSWNL